MKRIREGFHSGGICRHSAAKNPVLKDFSAAASRLFMGSPSGSNSNEYIRETVERYSDTLLRLCFTYVKNTSDAEDLTQEVFLSLIKREIPFESDEHEKAWLLRLAINKCKNHLKSGWVRHNAALDDNRAEAEAIPDEHFFGENPVLEAVLSLPEKYRTPIHLYYYSGYTIKEIAAAIGKKEATVGTLLARGRGLLKDSMIGGVENE